jgi:hypothetical protein
MFPRVESENLSRFVGAIPRWAGWGSIRRIYRGYGDKDSRLEIREKREEKQLMDLDQ